MQASQSFEKAHNISATAGVFCNPLLKTPATHSPNMLWGLMQIKSDMLWNHYNLSLLLIKGKRAKKRMKYS